MFEFFLALFGGTYYGGKVANEKRKLKDADIHTRKLIDTLKQDNAQWIRCVVDDRLEHTLNELQTEDAERMRQRILDEAKLISVSDDMVLMGLLAQKAKIPRSIAENGIHSRGVWDYAEQQSWTEQRRFMVWYDKELRRNGLQEPLLFVGGVNENKVRQNISLASPVTATSNMISGRYFWAPMRIRVY